MDIIVIAVCVLCAMACATAVCVIMALYFNMKLELGKHQTPSTPEMTKEQFEKFSKADEKQASDFNAMIANLNAFMTGNEEETNVGKQERD